MILWIAAAAGLLISYRRDASRTRRSLRKTFESSKRLAPGLLAMIGAVGFTLALFPRERIAGFFNAEGFCGIVLVSLAGAVVNIPGPIAFPMAGALLKLGARPAVLASFITTLTMVGLVSAPLEISYFGKRFTLMRQLFSFLSALAIGSAMGVLL
jgi:uncharacterized membrane protein YraQ (UPF0718 family)